MMTQIAPDTIAMMKKVMKSNIRKIEFSTKNVKKKKDHVPINGYLGIKINIEGER